MERQEVNTSTIDCTKYIGRQRQICEGTSGHTPEEREAYLAAWEGQPVPAQPDISCLHRGDELEQVVCPECKTGTRVKVFACGVHGRCMIPRVVGLEEIRACVGCADILHLPTPD